VIRLDALLALVADLQAEELRRWVEESWVQPDLGEDDAWLFDEIDVARVRLIHDLRHRLDTPEESVPVVLSLLDQVYDLRRALNAMTRAVCEQPDPVREAVFAALRRQG
jgi:chaperone modulatory protein CbpM